jgi:hypothetical protein
MLRTLILCLSGFLVASTFAADASKSVVTTGSLLEEMTDLGRLARWPKPAYRTIQFSSYDRRSTTAESPAWFSNADGFGKETIPAFEKVLREPRDGQPGLYLLAEVKGPGAIARGWSAGMAGVLRVYVDPKGKAASGNKEGLIWEGTGYDFFARRSSNYLHSAGIRLDAGDAFIQQDADYLPIPFARGLRVTWEGNIKDLHFYHLQVREYAKETKVRSFDPKKDLKEFEPQLRAAVAGLTSPLSMSLPSLGIVRWNVQRAAPSEVLEESKLEAVLSAGTNWVWSPERERSGAVREFKLRLQADSLDAALRGCLLRIAFDGSQRPQVETPLGDFFASGPGVNPLSTLPFTVEPDGTMTCRFVMPYEKTVRFEIVNYTKSPVRLDGSVRISPWQWDDRSMYFHAKWRADHDLLAGVSPIDIPYTVTVGKGVFVGCAAIIVNPSGVPSGHGNWWGEGDEKILVDGELTPSTFGTGSEDYFNYSWGRSDLFDHPFCGAPLTSGPDTSGYLSNHRFQVLDAIPFERSLAVLMELWCHSRVPGLSYARIAYHYARPGAVDDHRALMPSDLIIPPLPKRKLFGAGATAGAQIYLMEQLRPEASPGSVEIVPYPLATQLEVTHWRAEKGGKLKLTLQIEKDGRAAIHLGAVGRTNGAVIRALLDGKPLRAEDGGETVAMRTAYAPRVLNLNFKPTDAKAGSHELVLECVEPGLVGLDYVWVKIK